MEKENIAKYQNIFYIESFPLKAKSIVKTPNIIMLFIIILNLLATQLHWDSTPHGCLAYLLSLFLACSGVSISISTVVFGSFGALASFSISISGSQISGNKGLNLTNVFQTKLNSSSSGLLPIRFQNKDT